MSDRQADLCIIGAGPGGYVAAIRAAQLGLKTVIVERNAVGGVCLNVGCIPTKAMLRTASVLDLVKRSAEFGVVAENVRLDYARAVARRDQVVKTLTGNVAMLLKGNGVEIVKGSARLLGPGRVQVSGEDGGEIQARAVILATGSAPARLPIPGVDLPGVIDSNGALELKEVPGRMLVIGGGAVGCEWANIFHAFGSQVTLVEVLPTLLPLEDQEIGTTLGRIFKKRGIDVRTGSKVEQIEQGADGALVCTVSGPNGQTERLTVDNVLIGVGRQPVTDGLGLEEAGVRTDNGWVVVDDHLRTNLPGVYAIGDLTRKKLLAHLASHQGIVAVENIAGHDKAMDYKVVPACTYTHPEVASVGLTEQQAREAGYNVQIGRFPFAANGRAYTTGETDGMVKIVADAKYGEVLGVHIIGPEASEMIPEGALALRLEATLEDIGTTIHAHPTLAEATMEAALAALGQAIHIARPRERRG